jgi:hypothetical protein
MFYHCCGDSVILIIRKPTVKPPADRKEEVHTAFLRDEVDVVVATIAFGMGIDKKDIRCVTHHLV